MAQQKDINIVIDGTDPTNWLDCDDPYEDVNTEQLPNWWTDAIKEFREHDLKPYKPPRFTDDVIVPPVVTQLESSYDIDIRFMGVGVKYGDSWEIYVDDEVISTVSRERTSDAYTRYEITSGEFQREVYNHVNERKEGSIPHPDSLHTIRSDVNRE
ncbi:hypothetical protein SAMN04487948_1263 [Halogranum amylolyticum]|uniref:Uncharacterized protein n=1 Tax=Halogranum amylolyticum TaxID=660520 RepID=A0A1H8WA28_9EURY|nr:hypothetical protein [Halogranum amylolyticum]SEP24512.1 hypothetical protein SAMN04487948_1263 [Halogranum amylolyticum]